MKNLLIINFFHSSDQHVGAIRTQRFAKYLPSFGWKPYVLTKPPLARNNDQTFTETNDTFYALTFPLNKPFHLESLIWTPFMLKKAVEILQKIPIEVVLISCPPFHQAMAGILLKKWYGVKLVIDYRDAWGLNPYRQRIESLKKFIFQGDKLLEHFLLRNANLLIVSHQEMKDRYLKHFRFLEGRVEVVYNGFDHEIIAISSKDLYPQFTILHLGDFYAKQKTRDPNIFLSALKDFISENGISKDQLQVLFVGEKYREVEEMISSKRLIDYVSCIDRVSHDAAMEYLNKSHVLLLIEIMDVMTTKVFEYLATGKPMLCLIKQGGELDAFIRNYSANAYILSNDLEQIKESVYAGFENYRTGKYRGMVNDQFLNDFSRKTQTKYLAKLLDRMRS